MEDALYEVPCMATFAQLDLFDESMLDETTILKFRQPAGEASADGGDHERHQRHIGREGLLLKGGTMVDATIIHAPPSTKNEAKQRDPEMRQTKKGNQWYFGMKIHVGADVNSGLAHTVSVTPANEADVRQLPNLLREDDRAVFGDKGYVDNSLKRVAWNSGVFWGVALKSTSKHKLSLLLFRSVSEP